MRTSLDTNVLSAVWSKEASASRLVALLGEARQSGAVLVSGVVYAELLAYPNATEDFINDFLRETGIVLDLKFQDAVWIEAGRRFARYAARRRRSREGNERRVLADFLVGAHALLQADRLLTLDPGRYKKDFPELRLS
jgi:predicted nucleic acid-binding protein